jgi:hypothetical protein
MLILLRTYLDKNSEAKNTTESVLNISSICDDIYFKDLSWEKLKFNEGRIDGVGVYPRFNILNISKC